MFNNNQKTIAQIFIKIIYGGIKLHEYYERDKATKPPILYTYITICIHRDPKSLVDEGLSGLP